MSTPVKKELRDTLDNNPDLCEQLMYCDVYEEEALEGFEFKELASHGGEGQGDDFWSVWSFTKDGETHLVKFQGWYASYVGAEFESWSFVEPKQRTITVYE